MGGRRRRPLRVSRAEAVAHVFGSAQAQGAIHGRAGQRHVFRNMNARG